MRNNEKLQLRDQNTPPTNEILAKVMGNSYNAFETFKDSLPDMNIEHDWQWYTPHKAWFGRGQHWWTTPRGANKEKTLYWLHVFEDYFNIVVWFKEINRKELLKTDVNEKTKQLITDSETYGKVATFPVTIAIFTPDSLCDILILIECKKRLECK